MWKTTAEPGRPGYRFAMAGAEDQGAVLALYRSLLGTPGCAWSEEYPDGELVARDIARGSLYCMWGEDGTLWGAASAGEDDDDVSPLPFWEPGTQRSCELSRVGIRRDLQGRGLAGALVRHILEDAPRKGFDTIRLLVSRENPAAMAVYQKLGVVTKGTAMMYGVNWLCQERPLP